MNKLPVGSYVFLRIVRCHSCGNQVGIVKNLDSTGFVYQEEHVGHQDKLCPGSDLDVKETEDKRGRRKNS